VRAYRRPRRASSGNGDVLRSGRLYGAVSAHDWDTDLKGFGVLCSGKTSAKSFIVQRDLPGRKIRRVTIANINELKFADAKDGARKLLLDMRGGKDRSRSRALAPCRKPWTSKWRWLDLVLAEGTIIVRSCEFSWLR
jgi:hypothetical protein